ncbi:PilZ domain-containing protein [Sulfurospirillum sp. T05]|uniref:PilZ domain-containing protein n=1 Tax=Sulfurospirillum tamanense TaxID=2813362 RepID=A0ABS2WSF0_9BACT|nr:PilZ domain-containing protein [Sulfurospirillum tamanensis]MBN2964589.1 PilZ domain-containing protein [Sulfurospirillum tamanensis]
MTAKLYTLCHLYFSTNTLAPLLKEETALFNITSLCANEATSFPKAQVYLMELDSITKEKLGILALLLKRHKGAHLYLLAAKELHQVILYKYALHVGIKEILFPFETPEIYVQTLKKIHQHLLTEIQRKEMYELGLTLWRHLPLVCYTDKTPLYASDAAREFLGEENFQIEDFPVEPFQVLADSNNQSWNAFCHGFKDAKETYMLFFPYEKKSSSSCITPSNTKKEAQTWLKSRLEEKETGQLSLILLTIDNSAELQKKLMEAEYQGAIHALKEKLSSFHEKIRLFAQWEESAYVLAFEEHSVESIKANIENFYATCKNIPSLEIFTLSAHVWHGVKEALPQVETLLDSMARRALEERDLTQRDISIFPSCGESLKEPQRILRTFYTFMVNKTPLKLQNIYKGLCINTASKVIKIKDKMVYFECQTLQAYTASESKKAVILSAELPFDIHGSAKFINFEEKYLIADSFYFLPDSTNSREYTRVQPSFRNPVYLKQGRVQVQGDMLDVSLKSIAFTSRQNVVSLAQNQTSIITFKLPDPTTEEGFIEIRATGKVVSQRPLKDLLTKIVVLLTLKDPYDAYLLRYMYMRQKELINELKQLTKNGQH